VKKPPHLFSSKILEKINGIPCPNASIESNKTATKLAYI